MKSVELLTDAFERINEEVHGTVEDLSAQDLNARLDPRANSVTWLVWHLTRVQDDHVADAAGQEQVWTSEGWADRFSLPLSPEATGFGQSAHEVGQVEVDSGELLLGYFDAVHARTQAYVAGLDDAALDRIVDENWSPPVTLGVRLVSVVSDCLQHIGQAAFVRGVLERR